MTGVLIRRHREKMVYEHRHTGETPCEGEAETGVMHLQAKACLGLSEARKKHGSADTLISDV